MLINPPQELAIYTILKTAIEELIKVNICIKYIIPTFLDIKLFFFR